jgi:hypothetical protein
VVRKGAEEIFNGAVRPSGWRWVMDRHQHGVRKGNTNDPTTVSDDLRSTYTHAPGKGPPAIPLALPSWESAHRSSVVWSHLAKATSPGTASSALSIQAC